MQAMPTKFKVLAIQAKSYPRLLNLARQPCVSPAFISVEIVCPVLDTLTSLSDQALTFAPVNFIAHGIYDSAMHVIGLLWLRTVADDFIVNIIHHDL